MCVYMYLCTTQNRQSKIVTFLEQTRHTNVCGATKQYNRGFSHCEDCDASRTVEIMCGSDSGHRFKIIAHSASNQAWKFHGPRLKQPYLSS